MVIFLDGDNVTWTSYTPIDHVQWQISNQGLHGRNFFFRFYSGVGTQSVDTLQDTMSSFFAELFWSRGNTCSLVQWKGENKKSHHFLH